MMIISVKNKNEHEILSVYKKIANRETIKKEIWDLTKNIEEATIMMKIVEKKLEEKN